LAQQVPPERWLTINAGDGVNGRRWYAWAQVELAADGTPAGWGRRLLIRRSLSTGELAFYRRHFAHAGAFMAFTGLVPCERSSADSVWRGHITRTGSKHLRFQL
jgi:hypothetical protein